MIDGDPPVAAETSGALAPGRPGIGVTVSPFIAALAHEDAGLIQAAKMGVLAGSSIAATLGVLVIRAGVRRHPSWRSREAVSSRPHISVIRPSSKRKK